MISYYSYKFLHVAALAVILLSLGTALFASRDRSEREKKWVGMLNGIGLFVLLVAGFGLLARLAISWPWSGWVFIKLLAWMGLGSMHFLSRRFPESGAVLWCASLLFTLAAVAMAIFKPF